LSVDATLGRQDDHCDITFTLVESDGTPLGLVSASKVYIIVSHGNSYRKEKEMTISDAEAGIVTVKLDKGTLKEGHNDIKVRIEWSGGTQSESITEYRIRGIS
jgi:hypothetical protein